MKIRELLRFGPRSTSAAATTAAIPQVKGIIQESVQPAVGDTRDTTDGGGGKQFRRISQATRDFMPMKHTRIRELAFYLFQRNPLAKRLITIVVDFTLGDELAVKVKIKKRNPDGTTSDTGRMEAQGVWDEFADDPVNAYYTDIDTLMQDLLLFGELFLPVTIEPQSGKVRIGYIDCYNVSAVIHDVTGKQVETIVYNDGSGMEKKMPGIRVDVNPQSPTYNKLIGDAFFHRINRVMNQTRGLSELTEMLDWIDALDQFLFNDLEGTATRNAFIWHLQLEGATKDEIDNYKVETPRTASVKVTNEKATWDAINPKFTDANTPESVKMYKTFILGGKGYPNHFFGESDHTTQSSAPEMSIPTMRMLKRQQKKLKEVIRQHVAFVIDKAPAEKLKLAADEFYDIEVLAFDFERADAAVMAAGFVQTVTALVTASSKNWVSDAKAKQVMDGFLQRMGIEPDPDETVEEIADENQTRDATLTMEPTNGATPPGVVTPSKKSANAQARQPKQPQPVEN